MAPSRICTEFQVLPYRKPGKYQASFRTVDEAEFRHRCRPHPGYVPPVKTNRAGVHPQQAREGSKRRGLAGPVRAYYRDYIPLLQSWATRIDHESIRTQTYPPPDIPSVPRSTTASSSSIRSPQNFILNLLPGIPRVPVTPMYVAARTPCGPLDGESPGDDIPRTRLVRTIPPSRTT